MGQTEVAPHDFQAPQTPQNMRIAVCAWGARRFRENLWAAGKQGFNKINGSDFAYLKRIRRPEPNTKYGHGASKRQWRGAVDQFAEQ